MTTKHDRLESLFMTALQMQSAVQRQEFIDESCSDDSDLKAQVTALIENHLNAGSFLGSHDSTGFDDSLRAGPAGSSIGQYRLLNKAGEGGFGIVYMAEQQQPLKRIVAIKLLKPGMDSTQVVLRFEHERQALALMDHPNIARVLDAGTTDSGLPYFVMEYVDGVPINSYCDLHRLSIKSRLHLFMTVCQAVQYSHQKGIVHRDLKPSNVMVTNVDGQHVLKVIDFGIAKAIGQKLTERTLLTQTGGFMGTLQFMSPEQAEFNAIDIDTRADIYGLGILLFELLTGTTPLTQQQIETTALDDILRVIREVESPLPSRRLIDSQSSLPTLAANRSMEPTRLCATIRGELDWIVAKCLEKDRARRYESANDLSRDIERYLNNEAIEAGPPSAWYKLRKFSRKHWRSLMAASAMVVLLATSAIAMTSAYFIVNRERHDKELALQAEQDRRRETRAALDAMTSLIIEDWLVRQTTLQPEHKAFLQKAVKSYEQFANDTGPDQSSRFGAASASSRVGAMLLKLGQTDEAELAYQRALEGHLKLVQDYPSQKKYEEACARIYTNLAGIYATNGRHPESEKARQQCLEIYQRLVKAEPDNADYRHGLAIALNRLGLFCKTNNRPQDAENLYRQAIENLEQAMRTSPDTASYMPDLSDTYLKLGVALEIQNKLAEGEAAHRESVKAAKQVVEAEPKSAFHRYNYATSLNNLGNVLRDEDKLDEAEKVLLETVEIKRALIREFPSIPEYPRGLAMTLNNLGILYKDSHRPELADAQYREALDVHQRLVKDFPEVVSYKNELAGAMVNLARIYIARQEPQQAKQLLVDAEPFHRVCLASNPNDPIYKRFYRLNRWRLAESCLGLKDHQSASAAIDQFLASAMELPRDEITCAGLWSQCIELAEQDEQLPEADRKQLAASYGNKAIDALRHAIDRDPKQRQVIQQDATFAPLRPREDFQGLLQ